MDRFLGWESGFSDPEILRLNYAWRTSVHEWPHIEATPQQSQGTESGGTQFKQFCSNRYVQEAHPYFLGKEVFGGG